MQFIFKASFYCSYQLRASIKFFMLMLMLMLASLVRAGLKFPPQSPKEPHAWNWTLTTRRLPCVTRFCQSPILALTPCLGLRSFQATGESLIIKLASFA